MNIESISSENLNKELAYLLGVYLTDGSISHEESYTFSLKTIDLDFAEKTLLAFKELNPYCTAKVFEQSPRTRFWPDGRVSKTQKQYCINVGFARFGEFFKHQTGNKHHIPLVIWSSARDIKKMFIAGVMDGDGWISKTSRKTYPNRYQYRIGVGEVEEGWIWEFEKLLQGLGVKTLKPEINRLSRISPMVRIGIKVESFADNGLFFTIGRKQNRLLQYIKERSET